MKTGKRKPVRLAKQASKRKTYKVEGKRVPKSIWAEFHPRGKKGFRKVGRVTLAKARLRLAAWADLQEIRKRDRARPARIGFPKSKRIANPVRTKAPRGTRFETLVSPKGRPVVHAERATKLSYTDSNHNEDVISGMMAQLFFDTRVKLGKAYIVSWRGGVVFLASHSDDKEDRPIWLYPPKGTGTQNYATFEMALAKAQELARGMFQSDKASVANEHRYRLWILRVAVWATLAGPNPLGIKETRRRGGKRKE